MSPIPFIFTPPLSLLTVVKKIRNWSCHSNPSHSRNPFINSNYNLCNLHLQLLCRFTYTWQPLYINVRMVRSVFLNFYVSIPKHSYLHDTLTYCNASFNQIQFFSPITVFEPLSGTYSILLLDRLLE